MAFSAGKFRDAFARRPSGTVIDVPNERARKRGLGFVLEQKKWFWAVLTGVAMALSAAIMVALIPRGGFNQAAAAVLAGTLAGCLCQCAKLLRKTQIKLMRMKNKVHRTERKLEKFNIKILRELRLPLKNIRKKSGRILEVSQRVPNPAVAVGIDVTAGGGEAAEPDWGAVAADARSICESGASLDRLPAGLLRIGKIHTAGFAPNWLDMNTLVVSVLTSLKPKIDEAGARVQFKDLPSCVGDDGLVRELFVAIVSNAIENLSPDRGGLIRIWGQYAGSRIIYCVEDNGVGIAAEEFENIFEMFYRVDVNSHREGLGLAIVRDIVSRHKGRIWLKSTLGKGSTFSVALPAR